MSLRLRCRLQLVEASWPSEVTVNSKLRSALRWKNAGVAPCLPGGYPTLTLKDDERGIVGLFTAEEFDVRTLPVGPPEQADVRGHRTTSPLPPILKAGTCQVYVSVGTRTGTPRIALPLANDEGARRYRLGTITVLEPR
jgi:hypothetical protein